MLFAARRCTPASLPITPTQIADAAGYSLLGLTVGFFALAVSRRRLDAGRAQAAVCDLALFFWPPRFFWSEFEQAGSTLNLFADRDTSTSIFGWSFPSSWFQSLQPLFIITLAPVFAWLWIRLGAAREPSSPAKFALGLLLRRRRLRRAGRPPRSSRRAACKVSPDWLVVTYLLHTFGELCAQPGRPERDDQARAGARRAA